MCDSTIPSTFQWILNASKMLFKEDYHSISLMLKVAQLMKHQNPTEVVPGEHKFHFKMFPLRICFYCWVYYAWHCIFVLEKMSGSILSILSWPLDVASIF